MEPKEPLVVVEDLVKRYGDKIVLDHVSLHVDRGETLVVVGGSGAGKSTLIRQIVGLERPDSGRIRIDGIDLLALGEVALLHARRRFAVVFQNDALLDSMSVFDNVAFPLRIHRHHSPGDILRRVRECLHIVGLLDKIDSHPAQLSGGQKQRVAIARALATSPEVLLCDEPTSALDAETTRSVLDTLRDINQRLGVTIVIVTHELAVVRALCKHVAVMEHGEVAEQFAVADPAGVPRTALGRELARQMAQADVRDELDRLEAAYA